MVIGTSLFLLVCGPTVLNPCNISWIFSGDPTQHYLGWAFFRLSPWDIPPGLNHNYGGSISSSIVYSDSIPLLALFFKSFENYLPNTFQYFGIWYLTCFVLQAWFAWRLLELKISNSLYLCISTIIICLAPAFISQVGINAALSGHFLILASIYLTLRKETNNKQWLLLLLISLGVHFYIFILIGVVFFSFNMDSLRFGRISKINFFSNITFALILIGVFGWIYGYFAVSTTSINGGGYGSVENSLNIAALFYTKEMSTIWGVLNFEFSPGNSLNYFGIGIIIALILIAMQPNFFLMNKEFLKKYPFLTGVLFLLFLISISNTILVGDTKITYPIPKMLEEILGVFRASRRLFWLPYYFITLFILYFVFKNYKKKYSFGIAIFILALQITDISRYLINLKGSFRTYSNIFLGDTLNSPAWQIAGGKYNNLLRFPMMDLQHDGVYEAFAFFALKNRMVTNSVYLARPDNKKFSAMNKTFLTQLETGKFDVNSMYILHDNYVMPAAMNLNRETDIFLRLDGFNLLLPGWKSCMDCLPMHYGDPINPKIPNALRLNESIRFGKLDNGHLYLLGIGAYERVGGGWSYPEEWGVWSEGERAQIFLPLPAGVKPKKIILKLRALVSQLHPIQHVQIWSDFKLIKQFAIRSGSEVLIEVPVEPHSRSYLFYEFKFLNPISPKQLGMGDDNRKLAIGLEAISIQ